MPVKTDTGVGVEFDVPCTVRTLTSGNERKLQMCHVRIVDNGEPGTGNPKKGIPLMNLSLRLLNLRIVCP